MAASQVGSEMRRLTTAMLVCLPAGVVGVLVLAQEPSPPAPGYGGQCVEMPDQGTESASRLSSARATECVVDQHLEQLNRNPRLPPLCGAGC